MAEKAQVSELLDEARTLVQTRPEQAMVLTQQALEQAQATGNQRAEADALALAGMLFGLRGELDAAADRLGRALALCEALGDDAGAANSCNNLCMVCRERGELDRAMALAQRCLAKMEQLRERHGVASAYLNIGLIHADLGDWDRALENYFRALAEKEGTEDRKNVALYYNNIGELYMLRGKLDRANFFLARALETAQLSGSSWVQAEVLGTMGEVAFRAGDRARAQSLYEQDEAICRKSGDRDELAEVLRRRAELDIARGEPLEARVRLDQAEALCRETGSKREQGNVLRTKALLALLENDSAAAERYAEESARVLRSLGRNYELACSLVVLARAAPSRQDALREAQTIFENLGAVGSAAEARELAEQTHALPKVEVRKRADKFPGVVGVDTTLAGVFETIERAARTRASVLILGESGTGKEVVARTLHRLSDRADRPFVAVNCAAIPETLLESELFGVERGTATGVSQREGKFETAQGGTIFLDEVGDMSLSLQAKLLRVLQDRTFERVGGRRPIEVDVRIVAATNKDLEQAMAEGRFRRDLFYRLNVITVSLPPLRERTQDIPELVRLFIRRVSEEYSKPVRGVTDDCLACLVGYSWPGNIRELENVIERGVILARGEFVTAADLPASVRKAVANGEGMAQSWQTARRKAASTAGAGVERQAVEEALKSTGWVVKRAADRLGISRRQLYRIIQRYGLKRPE